jgi:hypothetical protein
MMTVARDRLVCSRIPVAVAVAALCLGGASCCHFAPTGRTWDLLLAEEAGVHPLRVPSLDELPKDDENGILALAMLEPTDRAVEALGGVVERPESGPASRAAYCILRVAQNDFSERPTDPVVNGLRANLQVLINADPGNSFPLYLCAHLSLELGQSEDYAQFMAKASAAQAFRSYERQIGSALHRFLMRNGNTALSSHVPPATSIMLPQIYRDLVLTRLNDGSRVAPHELEMLLTLADRVAFQSDSVLTTFAGVAIGRVAADRLERPEKQDAFKRRQDELCLWVAARERMEGRHLLTEYVKTVSDHGEIEALRRTFGKVSGGR